LVRCDSVEGAPRTLAPSSTRSRTGGRPARSTSWSSSLSRTRAPTGLRWKRSSRSAAERFRITQRRRSSTRGS